MEVVAERKESLMMWYYKLLARRPYLVMLVVAFITVPCIIVSMTLQKLPDFTDPTLGFEARGTNIGQRLTAWANLLEEIRPSGSLVANPSELQSQRQAAYDKINKKYKHRKKHNKNKKASMKSKLKLIKNSINNTALLDAMDNVSEDGDAEEMSSNSTVATEVFRSNTSDDVSHRRKPWSYGQKKFKDDVSYTERVNQTKNQWQLLRHQYPPSASADHSRSFCTNPNSEYAHFVVQRVHHNLSTTLFEINGLLAMCDLEFQITQTSGYEELCENELAASRCCRPWSLPNYVAVLANRSSCFDLEADDVDRVRALFVQCATYYRDLKLSGDCASRPCARVPLECAQHNAIYNVLHYLVDSQAAADNATTSIDVQAAMIFIPVAKTTKALPLYYELEAKVLGNQLVAVTAMDMGLKNALFDDCLMLDFWLLLLAGIFIMASMWLYTKSFLITLLTFVAILFSLGLAYFIYTIVFKLPFFPFMNLLAVIVIVGIGADDAFIYVKVWNCAIADRELAAALPKGRYPTRGSLTGLIAVTLRHAAFSMGVTTLTTAVAFFSSYYNSITAVKCFSIFAGTAVICNFLLMVTWLPASVSLVDRLVYISPTVGCTRYIRSSFGCLSKIGSKIETLVVAAVLDWPAVWIVLLGSAGVTSGLIVFWWPRLQLPDSPEFKLFDGAHPFELYDSQFRNRFWFEKSFRDSETMPVRFVWGVLPIDTGDFLDPSARGELHFDETLNVSSIASQTWLLEFCHSFKRQPFYQPPTNGPMMLNCFVENFIRLMERRCVDPMSEIDRTPCCETNHFPYEPHIFELCLPQIMSILYQSPSIIFLPGVAGPKFGRDMDNESLVVKEWSIPMVRAVVLEFPTNQTFSMSYTEIAAFQASVQTWFDRVMATAPVGMRGAWFISELSFFDLQDTLSADTLQAIITAMFVSLLVLVAVTLNCLISFYAIVTVTFTIFTTIAILVLMGWKLNVLESISVSTAIGLTIDFSLHYGNYYRVCPTRTRVSSTEYSLTRMIGPTLMAALTTGAAGAFMLPSRVLAYIQIGKFLVIVMTVSWVYATFFLMSVLRVMGPQNGYGQLQPRRSWLWLRVKLGVSAASADEQRREHRSAGYNATDQLISPSISATGELQPSESHELNALQPNSLVKPLTELEALPISFDRAMRHSESLAAGALMLGDGRHLSTTTVEASPSSTKAIVPANDDDEFDVHSIH